MSRFSPEPLRAICLRYVAAHMDEVESLLGLDEESVAIITAIVLQKLDLTVSIAAKLRATGHPSVIKMLKPYSSLDLIPEPASESPTPWD